MAIIARYLTLLWLIIVTNIFVSSQLMAQDLWKEIVQLAAKNQRVESVQTTFKKARLLQLDTKQMQSLLTSSEIMSRGSLNTQNVEKKSESHAKSHTNNSSNISLPLPDGSMISVQVLPAQVLPKALAEKYPEIHTFKLKPDENIIAGRLDITPIGFHALLQTRRGETIFIDPLSTDPQKNTYASYRKSDQHFENNMKDSKHQCLLDDKESDLFSSSLEALQQSTAYQTQSRSEQRSVQHFLQYRIAIAATGEYVAIKGGKRAALSAIASTLNRVNQVYEQDLGIHLSLVDNNDLILFEDASSDPYTSRDTNELISINQKVINNMIGAGNYDIGHLFSTSGGGLAVIGSVCNDSSKAMGVSGTANPGGDSFSLDFVAHEIGHQIGATHTFNSSKGLCAGNTRTNRTAFEPGSGSTIMSYAGICGSDNLQSNADAMFHIGSIEQIRAYTQSGNGSRCGIRAVVNNKPPQPNAGNNYVIPANTPFELQGNANDPDGDDLVYAWEQVDVGSSSQEFEDKGDNALFRAHLPNQSSSRSFPPLGNILNHRIQRGENLPIRERRLRFKLVAQDGYNGAQSDEMSVVVKRTGSRFALAQPRAYYSLGRDYKITWNTANTEKAPIYCDSVNVMLSTDGGYNFDHRLETGVPNTGETWVYLSSSLPETSQARFKLVCTNNIFFALSYRNFRLTLDDLDDAPEPGPESDLLDKSTRVSPSQPSGGGGSTVGLVSGGGVVNPLWILLLLVFRCYRKSQEAI